MKLLRSLHQPQHENIIDTNNYGLGITVQVQNPGIITTQSKSSYLIDGSGLESSSNHGITRIQAGESAKTETRSHLVPTTFPAPPNSRDSNLLHYVPAPVTIFSSKLRPSINPIPSVERQPTLFTKNASPERKMAELKNVLGKEGSGRLHSKAQVLPPHPNNRKRSKSAPASPIVTLEQAKSRPRIELDLLLDSGTCVESGYLKGTLLANIRSPTNKEGPLYVGGGKVRIVGFEAIPFNDLRHTFYHCGAPLDNVSPYTSSLYTGEPDADGFCRAQEGNHVLPFAMRLPPRDTSQPVAKGAYSSRINGSSIRYIAIVSIKMKDAVTNFRSIAHFYRTIEIWPLFDPAITLAPSSSPIYANVAKNIFLGGEGTLKLTASLHRPTWIAGQRCYVRVFIANDTEKGRVHSLALSLIRFETIFKPKGTTVNNMVASTQDSEDKSTYQPYTTKRIVARTLLEMGDKAESRRSTAKGWWTGVESGKSLEFNHYIVIPSFALTIPRSRLIEVEYMLDIGAGTGPFASDISVKLPIRIINFLSIDPPPTFGPPDKLRNLVVDIEASQKPPSTRRIVDGNPPHSTTNHLPCSLFRSSAHLDDNGTYRGSVGMPRIGNLRVQNYATNDIGLSASHGFSNQGLLLLEERMESSMQPALQESDEGLVEPNRQGDLPQANSNHIREPISSQSTMPRGRSSSQPSIGSREFRQPASNPVDSSDSSDVEVELAVESVNPDREMYEDSQLGLVQPTVETIEHAPKEPSEPEEIVSLVFYDNCHSVPSRDAPHDLPDLSTAFDGVGEDATSRAACDNAKRDDLGGGTIRQIVPNRYGTSAPIDKAASIVQSREGVPRRPFPRPHAMVIPKRGIPGATGMTLRQSLDLSKRELMAVSRPPELIRSNVEKQHAPQETVVLISECSVATCTIKESTQSLQVMQEADRKMTSPQVNIPATISALMQQNIKTPLLNSPQGAGSHIECRPEPPKSNGQVATFSKQVAVESVPRRRTGTSIQSRIAMFERQQDQGGENGRPRLTGRSEIRTSRPSRTSEGDPFRSKRM